VTRGTDPHIFLVRALHSAGLTEKDISEVLLQHPDGRLALDRGDVDALAVLDPMIEHEFPLAEAKAAHTLIETGHVRGKIILGVV